MGKSRELLVDGLERTFVQVRDSGESRWVSLEAPSGQGKTRVGREFYARLAARQSSPRYWPEAISNPDRKAVVPTGDREAWSLPEFLWWGVSYRARDGVGGQALRSFLGQLERHAPFVSIACRRSQSITEKAIQGFRKEWLKIAKELALDFAGKPIPLFGPMQHVGSRSRDAIQDFRKTRKVVREPSDISEDGAELASEVIDDLCTPSKAGFPLVVFIEDLHLADSTLLEVMRGLLRRGTHSLVVTTTWPGMIDEKPELHSLVRELGTQVWRVDERCPENSEFPDGAGFVDLDTDDRARIVLGYYPQADSGTVDTLTSRYASPGPIVQVCEMPKYRDTFGDRGDLYISPEEIESLPYGTADLYREHWKQLPVRLRLRYAVAAAVSPEEIHPESGLGHHTWSDPILDEVIERLKLPASKDLAGPADAALDVYGWVVHIDANRRRWAETDQHNIAASDGRALLNKHVIPTARRVHSELAQVVLREGPHDTYRARAIIALDAQELISAPDTVTMAIATVLNDLGHDDTLRPQRRRLYDRYLVLFESSDIDAHADVLVRLNGIDAFVASDPEASCREYRDLRIRAEDRLGPVHPDTLKTRNGLGVALRHAGNYEEAVTELTQLAEDRARLLDEDHPDTLETRNSLAVALRHNGQTDKAIKLLKQVDKDRTQVLGGTHPDTLRTRNSLAVALRHNGQTDKAIKLLKQVDKDRTQVLGGTHPDTLRTRNSLAVALRHNGQTDKAIKLLKQVDKDRTQVLGEDHPDTLRTRNSLAVALRHNGQTDKAIKLLKQVDKDRTQVLGEDHPDTLRTRNNLEAARRHARRSTERGQVSP